MYVHIYVSPRCSIVCSAFVLVARVFAVERDFSSCSEQGLLCCSAQASLCGGFSCCRAWALECGLGSCGGLRCSVAAGRFPGQGLNCVPCSDRWILSHCTTREVLIGRYFLILYGPSFNFLDNVL